MALHLGLRSSVTDSGMQKNCTNTATDERKLFIAVRTAVIDVKFIWNSVSGNGIFQDFLKVSSIIIIKEFPSYKESGMVINDHDTVDTAALTIFGDMGKITGIRLPHLAKHVFFEGFAVTNVRISG